MDVLGSVDFWTVVVPVFIAALTWGLNERAKRDFERWQMKKGACLDALNLANAVLSNYEYVIDGKPVEVTPQHASVAEVRACLNNLACVCEKPDVLNVLKDILFSQPTPAAILDLRAAVRDELGMKPAVIDADRGRAFVAKVMCERRGDA